MHDSSEIVINKELAEKLFGKDGEEKARDILKKFYEKFPNQQVWRDYVRKQGVD